MSQGDVVDPVGMIRAGIDALLKSDLTALSSVELAATLRELEVERRRCDAVDVRLIAEAAERYTAGDFGRTNTVDLLIDQLRISPREATARVRRAAEVGPRRGLTGEPLQPIYPVLADAVHSGVIGAEHADVILKLMDRIPGDTPPHIEAAVEQALVAQSLTLHPRKVHQIGEQLLARLDQDGPEPRDQDQQRRRDFGIHVHPDGSGTPYGRWTPQLCAIWAPILDALSAPIPADEDGEPDDRTPGQRRHDALLEAGQRLLRCGELPDAGGIPVTVLVHIDEQQLRQRTGYATTGHGELISVAEALRLAAEADIIPVVLNDAGAVAAYGRSRRLASPRQRLALAARDRGCVFPGCTRPPAWCQTHHVIPWLNGGTTDLDNTCLLCSWHHREFERRGWTVRMNHGVPEWIPPPWLDAQQRPLRNTAHHLPDFDFLETG